MATSDARSRLLETIPAREHRYELAGVSTAVLEGGDGPPVILLHGPGESAMWWMRVVRELVHTDAVIVPDLPGHGASDATDAALDEDFVLSWLDELIRRTCSRPPVLVGHLLGGSIAARFAARRRGRLSRLVLVNSFGIGKFRPALGFAFRLIRFMVRPTRKNYQRFLPQCMFDVDELRESMGADWEPFLEYNLECANDSEKKSALRELMQSVGIPRISSQQLAQIDVPTALIWGRHDRANRLQIAEHASDRFGWPLHVIEEARDDPKLERPDQFLQVLYRIVDGRGDRSESERPSGEREKQIERSGHVDS